MTMRLLFSLALLVVVYLQLIAPRISFAAFDTCATITNVGASNSTVESSKVFNCNVGVTSDYAGSKSVACGISFDGGWPLDFCPSDAFFGGWSGSTASFNCVIPNTNVSAKKVELVGYDFRSSCGPSTGKRILLNLKQTSVNAVTTPSSSSGNDFKFTTQSVNSTPLSSDPAEQMEYVRTILGSILNLATGNPSGGGSSSADSPTVNRSSDRGVTVTAQAQVGSCPASSEEILVPNAKRAHSSLENICIKPSMLVMHWVAAWQTPEITLGSLESDEYGCQFITDHNEILQTMGFYKSVVQRPACVAGYNDYNISNEIEGTDFDNVYNSPSNPHYTQLKASTEKALQSACWAMKQYNICPNQVYGHLELNPLSKADPGAEYIKYIRSRLKSECDMGNACINSNIFNTTQGSNADGKAQALRAFNSCKNITTQTSIQVKSTMSANKINQILSQYGSAATGLGEQIYALGIKYNINPAFVLGIYLHESTMGKYGAATHTLNVGNIRCVAGYTCSGDWIQFSSWIDGFEGVFEHLADLYIKGWGLSLVETIIPIWAPVEDRNDPCAYIEQILQKINEWHDIN
ncbi:N-acetylmuramoyl-L-alanine amidase [Candidatus Roizmanbacteria bacterium]|nr:N-acetylmuramoyl-L-alanine amidase [Candidatus Roizmanbacteria bacterium]